jgi:hypothetical protein
MNWGKEEKEGGGHSCRCNPRMSRISATPHPGIEATLVVEERSMYDTIVSVRISWWKPHPKKCALVLTGLVIIIFGVVILAEVYIPWKVPHC